MHYRAAPTLFFSIWALILKYWFWRLLYCPAWPRTIQGCYSHCDINAWGNSHVKYLDPCIQLKPKEEAETAEAFTIQKKLLFLFFPDLPTPILPYFLISLEFYWHEFSGLGCSAPYSLHLLVNTVKFAPGDMKHFKHQRVYNLGVAVHADSLRQQRYALDL